MFVLAVVLAGLVAAPQHGGACLEAVSLDPAAGQGDAVVFRAAYRHCEGASAFRIVQIYIGEEVTPSEPQVSLGYENGRFTLGDAAGDCAPGDAQVLVGMYGSFDCAASSVTSQGTDIVVDWAVEFDTSAFAGPHAVFFDAKGGQGDPEPRLEWTQMGTFHVLMDDESTGAATTGDASESGPSSESSTDVDAASTSTDEGGVPITGYGSPAPDPGCQCSEGPALGAAAWLGLLVLALRRRRAQPPCDST